MSYKKWINSSPSVKGMANFYYGEINAETGLMDPAGGIVKHDDVSRPFWHVKGGNQGTADTVGQAKAIVQKLAVTE